MKRVLPRVGEKRNFNSQENKRRQRFLYSRREGLRFRVEKNAKDAYTGYPNGGVNSNENESEDLSDSEEKAASSSSVDSRTNLYHCVLIGINWWKALKKLAPVVPNKLTRRFRESLTKECDTRSLEYEFGLNPTNDVFPKLEQYLGIDLYVLFGGKFSPLSIAYRPYRSSGPLHMRDVFKELDYSTTDADDMDDSIGVKRPVVVLQTARPFFHKLGNFYTLPYRESIQEMDASWGSIWDIIVKKRWVGMDCPRKRAEQIEFVKQSLGLAKNEKFQVSDGIFQKLRKKEP